MHKDIITVWNIRDLDEVCAKVHLNIPLDSSRFDSIFSVMNFVIE